MIPVVRDEPNPVLSTRTILLWGAGLLLVASASATALLVLLGGGTPADSARLDALRTAASIVVGTGGAAALLLTARRQRSAELDLVQKDHDATQRRVTEMYSKAADQLGSDKAPVRLAGLYALERLASDYLPQRQTIVNVLCAYLRMPFGPDVEPDTEPESKQELQVRKTAQRILLVHLRPGREADNAGFWPDIDLDFSGATLVNFTLTHCRVRSLACFDATFKDHASFRDTEFATKADFNRVTFENIVDFRSAQFNGRDSFNGTKFNDIADFGTKTVARLGGAIARTGPKRTWPPGWEERPLADEPGWSEIVPRATQTVGDMQ